MEVFGLLYLLASLLNHIQDIRRKKIEEVVKISFVFKAKEIGTFILEEKVRLSYVKNVRRNL